MSPDSTVSRRVIHVLDAVRDALPAVIAIVRPNDGATLPAGASTEFRAEVFDDGHGSPSITWRLGDGTDLGSGNPIFAGLPPGNHEVTATATFPDGTAVTDRIRVTVANRTPAVRIVGPRNPDGSTPVFARSEPINFRGSSFDPDVGPLRDDQVAWHLDSSAASFATGHSATVSLGAAVGEHTVTFRGCDDFGACAEDTVTIAIREDPPNLPPTVRITNPTNGAVLEANGEDADGRFHELTLQSDASDPEGGPVTLVWTDSIDGRPPVEIGTGPSPTVRLRAPCESARHQLTLTATDNAGNSQRDVVSVTVTTSC